MPYKVKPLPILTNAQVAHMWKKFDRSGGPDACWPFMGCRTKGGYGTIGFNRRTWMVSRLVVFWKTRIDPMEKEVLHSCDNRPCCNPKHLSAGTHIENMAPMRGKPRAAIAGEKHPMVKLSDEDIRSIHWLSGEGVSIRAISKMFNVTYSHVWIILKKKYRMPEGLL